MERLEISDLGTEKHNPKSGLDQLARRVLQVEKVKNNDSSYYFDKINFDIEVATWKWPLNLIDFETSTVALPFYQGKSPYSGVAFQWSHHVMHKDGRIEHVGEYINFEKEYNIEDKLYLHFFPSDTSDDQVYFFGSK